MRFGVSRTHESFKNHTHFRNSLVIAMCLVHSLHTALSTTQKQYVTQVESVANGSAKLPCKAVQHRPGDHPRLVLWYKDAARTPFLTLDLREHYPDTIIGEMMKNRVASDSAGEWLTVRPLKSSDSAQYKCQVDYENSPTLVALVNLTVYEPPSQLILQDDSNQVIRTSVLGPLAQDSQLSLYCIAIGGSPPPQLSWWSDSELLSDQSYTLSSVLSSQEDNGGMGVGVSKLRNIFYKSGSVFENAVSSQKVVSKLKIEKLSRSYAAANITCKAHNNNLTEALHQTISLDLYLNPTSVEIRASEAPLQEGYEARFKCDAKDSHPPAKITWQKGKDDNVITLEATNSINNGQSISWLTFTPTAKDHGLQLICRAYNPELRKKIVHTSLTIQVIFAPRVQLSLGTSLDIEAIKEGKDVYFDCQILANPKPKSITWHKDGEKIEQDLKRGLLVAGRHLVLQRIHRSYAGNYTCTVENDFGTVTSNAVELPVMFLPVCRNQQKSVTVAEGKSVRLKCDVDARPSTNLTFIWSFNNTLDTVEVSPDKIEVRNTSSVLHYTPSTPRDYGMLSCWATNKVGVQANPCRFAVTEAGPPERVKDCILVNLTGGVLEVECVSGSSGGSPQKFVAKVYASPSQKLVRELERPVPRFHVAELTPGVDYLVSITAVNDKGVSEPEKIDAIRLKVAEKRMGDVHSPTVSPLIGAFLSLVGGFVLLIVIGLLLSRARYGSNYMEKKTTVINSEIEDGPDIVKSSSETSQLLETRLCPDMIIRRPTYGPGSIKDGSGTCSAVASTPVSGRQMLEPQTLITLPSDESFV